MLKGWMVYTQKAKYIPEEYPYLFDSREEAEAFAAVKQALKVNKGRKVFAAEYAA